MYTKRRITTLFVRYGKQEAITFYENNKSQTTIDLISPPTSGVVMMKVRETAENSLFYLGEVTVVETKMKVNNQVGIGIVHGSNELSEALAFIDACHSKNLFSDELQQFLTKLESIEQQTIQSKTNQVLKTKVNFETMDQ